MKEAERHVISSGSKTGGGRSESKANSGSRRWKTASTGMIASSRSRIKSTTGRQSEIRSRPSNREVEVQGTTVH